MCKITWIFLLAYGITIFQNSLAMNGTTMMPPSSGGTSGPMSGSTMSPGGPTMSPKKDMKLKVMGTENEKKIKTEINKLMCFEKCPVKEADYADEKKTCMSGKKQKECLMKPPCKTPKDQLKALDDALAKCPAAGVGSIILPAPFAVLFTTLATVLITQMA